MTSYPEIDDVIGKFKIISVLGRGATSSVFQAYHEYLQSNIAVKILFPQLLEKDPKIEKIFFEEAVILNNLYHPNIIRVMDAEKAFGYTYITMEFIDGNTIDSLIKQDKIIDPLKAVRTTIDVCKALQYFLEQGYVHRDIKPANIMIDFKNKVKILDLGLAKAIDKPVTNQLIGGPMCGTLYYMSPEQLTDSERIDHRADMYSVGATLYHMIVGRMPFKSNDLSKLIHMHINDLPVSPLVLAPDVSLELSAIIMRLLEKSPTKRFSTYEVLINDLKKVESYYQSIAPPEKEPELKPVENKIVVKIHNSSPVDNEDLHEKFLQNIMNMGNEESEQKFVAPSSITYQQITTDDEVHEYDNHALKLKFFKNLTKSDIENSSIISPGIDNASKFMNKDMETKIIESSLRSLLSPSASKVANDDDEINEELSDSNRLRMKFFKNLNIEEK